MTYMKLVEALPSTEKKKMPTAKALRENVEVFIKKRINDTAMLTVYKNGYYTYSCDGRTTVYAVDRCTCVSYQYSDSRQHTVNTFDMEWHFPLILCAEERLERNSVQRRENCQYSYDNIPTDVAGDADIVTDMEIKVEKELIEAAINTLTLRQQDIVRQYINNGKTHQEIADELGVSRSFVSKEIRTSCNKMSKVLNREDFVL